VTRLSRTPGHAPAQHNHTYLAQTPASTTPLKEFTVSVDQPSTYPYVDVAIVAESTYPYLKGGVSAVIHDIVQGNQDLTFGIIHLTWDRDSAHEDLYGMPSNVSWVRPVYLSMTEHTEDFRELTARDLKMRPSARDRLAERMLDAVQGIFNGDPGPMWELYDEGMNPRTREFPLWALLGSKEFMVAVSKRLVTLDLPLVESFWLMREFFSLACAVLGNDLPAAGVYHAHTTGYAALIAAAAARQNDGKFLLTEHNLYVRDTVNFMLERSMALTLGANDWREFDVTPQHRAWMAWWIEMGRFCYPSAEMITYLYPKAVTEAVDLGAPIERSVVIPNGMVVRTFEGVVQQRLKAVEEIKAQGVDRTWRLVYIARVVPIKGLTDLIGTVALLVERGITNFHLDILGPTDHAPDYYRMCREKARTLNVESYLTFRGTVNVRELLGEFDILVLPSYNEGQPIVVLEAMTAGIPTVGTSVWWHGAAHRRPADDARWPHLGALRKPRRARLRRRDGRRASEHDGRCRAVRAVLGQRPRPRLRLLSARGRHGGLQPALPRARRATRGRARRRRGRHPRPPGGDAGGAAGPRDRVRAVVGLRAAGRRHPRPPRVALSSPRPSRSG